MPVLSTLGAAIANVYGFTSGLIKDQYFNLVSLLLPGNGTNGKKNNDFVDSSTANSGTGWPITPNGDVTQGTFSPFSQTGWGAYFDGSNDYVATSANNLSMQFGTGSYTVECWIYQTARNSNGAFFIGGSGSIFQVSINATGYLESSLAGVGSFTASTSTVPLNSWTHIALVRSSTSTNGCTYYINGNASGTYTDSNNHSSSTSTINIGTTNAGSSTYVLSGYISNMRIAKSAYYTSNFTPSITPLTTTSQGATNVTLLSLQNNRFIDNAATPNTLTANNGAAITPFSPFAPTSSYSAAAVGGSGYFDGSGDYLSVPADADFSFSTSSFTIEAWVYLTAATNNSTIATNFSYSGADGDWIVRVGSAGGAAGKWEFTAFSGGTAYQAISNSAVTTNAWTHIAAVRSGSTMTIYVNGVAQTTTATNSNSVGFSNQTTLIGSGNGFGNFPGYISNLRIVKGTAVVPPSGGPTSPVTEVSGTSLLLNFTNAGVVDATAKNVLETEGNAQISTAQSKWGGGSISFDGTGDYLLFPASPLYALGGGNFTIEFWLYINSTTQYGCLLGVWDPAGTVANTSWIVTQGDTAVSKLRFGYSNGSANTFVESSSGALSTGVWQYVAITRSGNTLTMYVNGSSVYSNTSFTTTINSPASTRLSVGALTNGNDALNGYIDDLRITRGVARTVTTSPSGPFPLQ